MEGIASHRTQNHNPEVELVGRQYCEKKEKTEKTEKAEKKG